MPVPTELAFRPLAPCPPASCLPVSRETPALPSATQQRLETLCDLILRWNASVNLIATNDEPHLWDRHVLNSLAPVPILQSIPHASSLVDFGSGAGFPALVLGIVCDHLAIHCIEANHRKSAFLRNAMETLNIRGAVHTCRIEDVPPHSRAVLTARALAPLPRLITLAAPWFQHQPCRGLFLKGKKIAQEWQAAQTLWNIEALCYTNHLHTVLDVHKIERHES